MPRPGPNVTSDADTQPGSDSLFPTGFSGGGALVRPGSVGTGEIADGSIAAADLNLASVTAALNGTYAQIAAAVSVTRDGAGRLASVTEGGVTTSLARDGSGGLSGFTVGATTRAIMRDGSGRIVSVA